MENLCNICPRNCNANRNSVLGFCKGTNKVKISKVMLHYFEEPPISGEDTKSHKTCGSGAIFFSNCTLKCCYCQNAEISAGGQGKEITTATLASLFKQLETRGANNINLVTPTHYTNQIIEALNIFRPKIPIVWNTSGYETVETIKKIKDYADIYLTDFKYFDSTLAEKYSLAKNYPEACKTATLEMRKNQPDDIFENGLMKKGMIIRHLVLPTHSADSIDVINWINDNLGNSTYVSLMSQYIPTANASKFAELNQKIKPLEYKIVVNHLIKLGFKNVFTQEFSSADLCYTPDFNETNSDFEF